MRRHVLVGFNGDPASAIRGVFEMYFGKHVISAMGPTLFLPSTPLVDTLAPYRRWRRAVDTSSVLLVPGSGSDDGDWAFIVIGCVRRIPSSAAVTLLYDEVRGRRIVGSLLRQTWVSHEREVLADKLRHVRNEPREIFPIATDEQSNAVKLTREDVAAFFQSEPNSHWEVTLVGILDVGDMPNVGRLGRIADRYDQSKDSYVIRAGAFRQDFIRVLSESRNQPEEDVGGFDEIDAQDSSGRSRLIYSGPPDPSVFKKCVDYDMRMMVLHRVDMYSSDMYYPMGYNANYSAGFYRTLTLKDTLMRECIAVTLLCKFVAHTACAEKFVALECDLLKRRNVCDGDIAAHKEHIQMRLQGIKNRYEGDILGGLAFDVRDKFARLMK